MLLYMVELTVADVAISQAWYEKALNLVTALSDEPHGFRLLEAPGGGRIALKQGIAQAGAVALQFEVTDVVVEQQRLNYQGIATPTPIKISPEGYRRLLIHDPDGHPIGLFDWHAPKVPA